MSTNPIDQSIKNWLHSLHDHDPGDLRGLVAGIGELLELLAQKLPPGPQSAPIHGEGFVNKGGDDE